jgi:hypothetical protein
MCFLCAYKSIDVISFAYLYTHSKYCNMASEMPTLKCLDRTMISLSARRLLCCACAETGGSRDDEGAADDEDGG